MDQANQNTPQETTPMDKKPQSKQPSKPFSTKMSAEEFATFRDHFLLAGYLSNANGLDRLKHILQENAGGTVLGYYILFVKQLMRHMVASLSELGLPKNMPQGRVELLFCRDEINELATYLATDDGGIAKAQKEINALYDAWWAAEEADDDDESWEEDGSWEEKEPWDNWQTHIGMGADEVELDLSEIREKRKEELDDAVKNSPFVPSVGLFRKLAWLSMQRWKEEESCAAKGGTPTNQKGGFLGMTAGKTLVPSTEKEATNSDNPFAWLDQLSSPLPDYEKDKKICDQFIEHLKKRLGK